MSTITDLRYPSDLYEDGMTKQAFKDDTDINKILAKAAMGDTITHLAKHGAVYGDFTEIDDLLDAQQKLARGTAIFMDLPGEVRREFNQSPKEFFEFVNNPDHADRLPQLLPGLAKPGTQMGTTRRTAESVAAELGEPTPRGSDSDPTPAEPAEPVIT